jgi:hypothetical protein
MEASIVDLRYKMKEVLSALDRSEPVKITYHGRQRGWLLSTLPGKGVRAGEHPFFGMRSEQGKDIRTVHRHLKELRKTRYADL